MSLNQFASSLTLIVVAIEGLLIAINVFQPVEGAIVTRLMIPSASLLLIYCLFYKMKIVVDDKSIRISYGVGLIKKSFSLDKIDKVAIVRNSIATGLGIRYHSDFVLYNIDGRDAVEITFKDRPRKVRIGTSSPHELYDCLLAQVEKTSP